MNWVLKQIHVIAPGLVVLLIVFFGYQSIQKSLAATSYATSQASTGSLSGSAVIEPSTLASGSSYVQFGAEPYAIKVSGPSSLTVDSSGTFNLALSSVTSQTNLIVDFEVYNAADVQVYQNFVSGQSLSSVTSNYTENWAPTAAGNYTISAGIFTSGWASTLDWDADAAALSASLPTSCPAGQTGTPPNCIAQSSGSLAISVKGNKLYNQNGSVIQLRGVDRSGTEYACSEGWGLSDGPLDAPSISVMKSWGVNSVRVPLNEDCWLGINGVSAQYSGAIYQTAINNYINLLNSAGIIAIIDLHWNAPGTTLSSSQVDMADEDHAPAFWTSVAGYFKNNHALIFDIYNEPNNISWSCWENGCNSPGWQTAGMQQLVNTVRATGATQPLMLGGLAWSNDLSSWLTYKPTDPDNQLIASFHAYNFNSCNNVSCWNQQIAPVAASVPVITGELGEDDCNDSFINSYMDWADAQGVSYLAWSWNAGNTCSGPTLVTNYTGTPNSAYGMGYEAHLQLKAGL